MERSVVGVRDFTGPASISDPDHQVACMRLNGFDGFQVHMIGGPALTALEGFGMGTGRVTWNQRVFHR